MGLVPLALFTLPFETESLIKSLLHSVELADPRDPPVSLSPELKNKHEPPKPGNFTWNA